jgi:hypothetical protein
MRLFIVFMIFLFIQCDTESKGKHVVDYNDSIKILAFPEAESFNLFPEYVYKPKDTIIKTWSDGVTSELILIGLCKTNRGEFRVFTEFSRVLVADGLRGQSSLCLINKNQDTLVFDAEMTAAFPIDLYENHFVFINEYDEYVFSEIDIITNEVVCFNAAVNKCFLSR